MPGCTLEAAHTQKKGFANCSHPETAMCQLFASFLASALLCMNAPSVGMVISMHPSASLGNKPPERGLIEVHGATHLGHFSRSPAMHQVCKADVHNVYSKASQVERLD